MPDLTPDLPLEFNPFVLQYCYNIKAIFTLSDWLNLNVRFFLILFDIAARFFYYWYVESVFRLIWL